IFEAKGRPADRPVSVLISTVDGLEKYAKAALAEVGKRAERFWPGPLSILEKTIHAFVRSVTAGKNRVSMRVRANQITHYVITTTHITLTNPRATTIIRPRNISK